MIEIKDVSFSYAGQASGDLENVSLTIQDGECVLLCGRSGCGKTTITRLINGLIPYFYQGNLQGTVLVNGMNMKETPMYQIASKVGSVFQNPKTQFFNVDTDSEIAFGIENQALPVDELEKRVDQTAKDLDIENLRGRNIFKLSGGEKQKIAFASVYAMNPEIYLLDEPSSNLDIQSIEELRKHLKLIKGQGKTVILAEHRIYYLMDLVDKIYYLDNGKIIGVYTPESFKALSEKDRMEMGLRAVELQKIVPCTFRKERNPPILELRNARFRYKGYSVLEHISLQAGYGEIIAVAGKNGTGKTTFSRTLCGVHKDFDGQILWNGKVAAPKQRLEHSYMVMQDVNYELFADSVEAECSFGIKNPDRSLVERTMSELGLLPYRNRHPNTLSGGQKQRTAVAVSMICKKELLVFDEPTSGLDYDSMLQVAALLQKLSKMNKIIFVVTHDFEFLCRTCTRILYFQSNGLKYDIDISEQNRSQIQEIFLGDREV